MEDEEALISRPPRVFRGSIDKADTNPLQFVNPKNCVLIVKPGHLDKAEKLFKETSITIISSGNRHLGAAIGSERIYVDNMMLQI